MVQAGRDGGATTTGSIAGGFVLVPVATLMTAWRTCRGRPSGAGDFRAWLACHELAARRCPAGGGRAPSYSFAELAKLLGVAEKRAGASIGRLAAAGLLAWTGQAISFPDLPPLDDPDLRDCIGGGRGRLAIPRRTLRFLAGGAGLALIATALAVLLRCLSRRRGGFDGRGRLKASWVARVFDLGLRQTKAARKELIDIGWIAPEDSDQWALNRWGHAYTVDLEWDAPRADAGRVAPPSTAGRDLAPPPADPGPISAPPDLHTSIPSGRHKHQEPAGGHPGLSDRGMGGRGGKPTPTHPRRRPARGPERHRTTPPAPRPGHRRRVGRRQRGRPAPVRGCRRARVGDRAWEPAGAVRFPGTRGLLAVRDARRRGSSERADQGLPPRAGTAADGPDDAPRPRVVCGRRAGAPRAFGDGRVRVYRRPVPAGPSARRGVDPRAVGRGPRRGGAGRGGPPWVKRAAPGVIPGGGCPMIRPGSATGPEPRGSRP